MLSSRSLSDALNGVLLLLCISLPWLSPLTATPSPPVIPLLVSWGLAACAAVLITEWPGSALPWRRSQVAWAVGLGLWLGASLLWVPEVVDRALTLGLLAALLCVTAMAMVGRRIGLAGDVRMRWLLVAWLLAAGISSVLGLLQYFDLAKHLTPWVNQAAGGEAFANLRQRNQFASLTSVGLVVLFAWVAQCEMAGRRLPLGGRVAAWALLVLLAAGVSASNSRTGAMEWACVTVLALCWGWRATRQGAKPRTLLWMALATPGLLALGSYALPWLSQLLNGHDGASLMMRVAGLTPDYQMCGRRPVLWRNVLEMIAQHPWLGWGWGETDYAQFMTVFSGTRFCDLLDNAHNLPLHLAMELGVPLALALIGSALLWVWRRRPWAAQQPWQAMAWGLLLILGLHSLLEYPLWYGPFQMTLGLALGLLAAGQTASVERSEPAIARTAWREQTAPVLVGGLLLLGCMYTFWDYQRVGQIYRPARARLAIYSDNPLAHAKDSWLFRNQAEFAELSLLTVTADNAATVYPLARRVMHYSPEPRVVQRAIDSARLLGLNDEAQLLSERLQRLPDNMKPTAPSPASSASH